MAAPNGKIFCEVKESDDSDSDGSTTDDFTKSDDVWTPSWDASSHSLESMRYTCHNVTTPGFFIEGSESAVQGQVTPTEIAVTPIAMFADENDDLRLIHGPQDAEYELGSIPSPRGARGHQVSQGAEDSKGDTTAPKRRRGKRGKGRQVKKIPALSVDARAKECYQQVIEKFYSHGAKRKAGPKERADYLQLDIALAVLLERDSAGNLKGNVKEFAFLSQWHSRVVQDALVRADRVERDALAAEMHGCVISALKSENAHWVLQGIVVHCPRETAAFIVHEMGSLDIVDVARCQFGSRVLQRLVEHATHGDALIKELVDRVAKLSISGPAFKSHHVVKTLFECANDYERNQMLLTLCAKLGDIVHSRFARDVIQTVLRDRFCAAEERTYLAQCFFKDASLVQATAKGYEGDKLIQTALNILGVHCCGCWTCGRCHCNVPDCSGMLAHRQLQVVAYALTKTRNTSQVQRLREESSQQLSRLRKTCNLEVPDN